MKKQDSQQSKQDRKAEERFQKRLREGGQRATFDKGQVLYERQGGESKRTTYLDRTNDVRPLMSGRLRIPDGLRSVGNLYGDSVLIAMLGPEKPFALEAVDGGKHGSSGGVSVRMVEAQELANLAQARMKTMPPVTYLCNAKAEHGPHHPLTHRMIVDAICAYGQGITEIALRQGWWVQGAKHPVVRTKQAERIKTALVDALGEIDEVWGQNGIDARGVLGVVEVR